jgi:quercetin dioxygenase-like cupin family protein
MKAVDWEAIPYEDVRPGVRRRAIGTSHVLLVMNECKPGMELRPHSHDFDQVVLIVAGRAIYHVDAEANEMGPGSVMVVPAGAVHYIEPLGEETVLNLDVFAPPRSDYAHLVEWMKNSTTAADAGS